MNSDIPIIEVELTWEQRREQELNNYRAQLSSNTAYKHFHRLAKKGSADPLTMLLLLQDMAPNVYCTRDLTELLLDDLNQ